MNIFRLTTITLSLTFLVACGGGGGSGTVVAPTTTPPTTTPPATGDPTAPPTTGNPVTPPPTTDDPVTPPPTAMPAILPDYAITDIAAARNLVLGSAPMSMTETEIITAIQTRATTADTFEFSNFVGTPDVDITCPNDSSCSGNVPDIGTLTFSLSDIEDLSLVDDTNLVGFNSKSQVVMEDRGATMVQSRSAARQDDGTLLAFQTYGGWLSDSVFGVELLDVTENTTTTNRFASFSFGKESGSNPTGASLIIWDGVMVGVNAQRHIIHGDASVRYQTANANVLHDISFHNVRNVSDPNHVGSISFSSIPLNDGAFQSTSGDIKGFFYGTGNTQVGGIFNKDNIIGAFGAVRLP